MSAALSVTPATLYTNVMANVTLTGAGDLNTRLKLDGVVAVMMCYLTGGTGSASITMGPTAGTQTITAEQLSGGTWGLVATLPVTVVAEPSGPSAPINVTANNITIEDKVFSGVMPVAGSANNNGQAISSSGGSAGAYITNLTIRHCTITGFRLGIFLSFIDTLVIEDCLITDADYAGIALFSCKNVTIRRNTIQRIGYVKTSPNWFQGNNAYGIMCNRTESASIVTDPPCQNVLIDGNSVSFVPLWQGINAHAGDTIAITNNHVDHCPRGIFVAGSPTGAGTTQPVGITVDDNVLDQCITKTGGTTDKTAITADNWTGTSIQNNRSSTTFSNALNSTGLSGVTIAGNTTF
jgi:parallel beta-helix repeat protein